MMPFRSLNAVVTVLGSRLESTSKDARKLNSNDAEILASLKVT